jgi:hypothetical protein
LPPTLQIKKKKEKDLYPPLNPPKTKRMDLYSPPINKKRMDNTLFNYLKKKKACTYPPTFKRTN